MATAFGQRDGTFELLRDGKYKLTPTAACLLWFLLFHGWYDPNSTWYGHVDIRVTGQDKLCIATGRTRDAVRRGLRDLEQLGFIKRYPRYHPQTGNRMNDGIKLTTPDDFCFTCRTRGHEDGSCEEGAYARF